MASGSAVLKETLYQLKRERDKLGKFIKTVQTKPYSILLEEASRMQAEMKLQTPVDSGDLRDSVKCDVIGRGLTPKLEASASSIHNGYNYAEIQHENPNFHHVVGKWKYIEDPFNAGVERIERRFEEEIKFD